MNTKNDTSAPNSGDDDIDRKARIKSLRFFATTIFLSGIGAFVACWLLDIATRHFASSVSGSNSKGAQSEYVIDTKGGYDEYEYSKYGSDGMPVRQFMPPGEAPKAEDEIDSEAKHAISEKYFKAYTPFAGTIKTHAAYNAALKKIHNVHSEIDQQAFSTSVDKSSKAFEAADTAQNAKLAEIAINDSESYAAWMAIKAEEEKFKSENPNSSGITPEEIGFARRKSELCMKPSFKDFTEVFQREFDIAQKADLKSFREKMATQHFNALEFNRFSTMIHDEFVYKTVPAVPSRNPPAKAP